MPATLDEWTDIFAELDTRRDMIQRQAERIESLRQDLDVLDKSHADLAHRLAMMGRLAQDLTNLLIEMPIKHPQQLTRRSILYERCRQLDVIP